ncbi:MAG: HAD family hydrolase [bacterium]|nr:HAD family hydrolase [bacterium]
MSTAPRILLLDLDDTVYAYEPCHRQGLASAAAAAAEIDDAWNDAERFEHDYAAARADLKCQIGRQAAAHSRLLYFKTMLESQFGGSRLGASRALQEAYWRGYYAAMRRDEGCAELLAEVRAWGLATAWITSFTTRRQMQKLRLLGLEDAADVLLTTEEAGVEKPDAALVDLALERLGAGPESAWVVGDSLRHDLPMAEARGLPFVWFRRPGNDGNDRGRAAHTVASWEELGEVLRRARGG